MCVSVCVCTLCGVALCAGTALMWSPVMCVVAAQMPQSAWSYAGLQAAQQAPGCWTDQERLVADRCACVSWVSERNAGSSRARSLLNLQAASRKP